MSGNKQHAFRALLFSAALALTSTALAGGLDVPIMERAEADLDTCAYGEVHGLRTDGDGFLAVRSGPSTSHRKIDEVYNGDKVWMFEQRGKWIGVVYGVDHVDCSPITQDREVPHPGKKGWVHENWVRLLAG